jgi:sulfite exporter TauE/SafE
MSADLALIGGAALLGLASTPHCAAMCAAPCAAVVGRGPGAARSQLLFQAARVAGYAVAGGIAAASVGAAEALAQLSPALRPLWVLLHGAMLVLGLWMLWQGRQPAWMAGIGRVPVEAGWAPVQGPVARPGRQLKAAAAGSAWVAWPCGTLQSALLLASLTGHAGSGAAAMGAFAVLSSAGLVAAPWIWQRLGAQAGREALLVRAAGLLLALGSVFALGHGIWHEVLVWCGLA